MAQNVYLKEFDYNHFNIINYYIVGIAINYKIELVKISSILNFY